MKADFATLCSASVDETLTSIAGQTSNAFECVVVDGASEDSTVQIAEGFRGAIPRLSISSEQDRGLYDAMNKGLLHARGRYVLFLNAGDVFDDRNVIGDFEHALPTFANAAMIYGHTRLAMVDGRRYIRRVRPLNYIQHGQPTIHQSVFFRRDLHLQHPYPYQRYPISSDYAVMAAIQKEYQDEVRVWDRVVARFAVESSSVSNRNLRRRISDAWAVQKDLLRSPLTSRVRSVFRRVVAHYFYNVKMPRLGKRPETRL